MSSSIVLSAGVRSNLLNLQNTANLKNITQERLSTGKKVNSALDNPVNYFTASSLTSRANDLSNLLDGISNGVQVLQAANNGIDAITSAIESLQSTVQQARSDSSYQAASYTIDAASIGTTTPKTLTLSGGSLTTPYNVALNTTGTTAAHQATVTSTANYAAPSAPAAAHQSDVTAASNYVGLTGPVAPHQSDVTATGNYVGLTGADTYSFDVNGNTVTLNSTTGDNAADAATAIQSQLDVAAPGAFTVSNNGGKLEIKGKADGSNTVTIDHTALSGTGTATPAGIGFDTSADQTDAGTPAVAGETYTFKVNGTSITLDSTTGADATTAAATIQTALGTTNYTVTNNGGKIEIKGKADGSNTVTVTAADIAASGGTATPGGLGFSTATDTTNAGTAATTGGYSFTVDGHAVTLDSTTGDTGADAAASISSQLSAFGIGATYDATSQKLTLTGLADGSNSITVAGTDAAAVFGTALTDTGTPASAGPAVKTVDQLVTDINTHLAGKVKATNDGGKLLIENVSTTPLSIAGFNSTSAEWDGSTGTTSIAGDSVRINLVDQFNQTKDQLDKLANDAGFNGINLLNGDALKLTFNESSTSSLTIQSSGALAGGVTAANLGITDATDTEFGDNDQLDARLTQLSNALTALRSQSSAFGSNLSIVQNRQDFTKNLINTLQVGSDNLTLADTNEEGANLLALNTRQQLETTSLSFASQADQAVLQFLRGS